MIIDAAGWEALRLSLLVGSVATVVSLPLAIWVACLLARGAFCPLDPRLLCMMC